MHGQMTRSYLMDTNILLRIAHREDRDCRQVNSALERLLNEDAALYYTHQNVAEFWNVWTRPAAQNGFGLTGAMADREIRKFESMMSLAADSSTGYDRWRELVLQYQASGVQVHDARLVATMLVSGIQNILTLNGADFARYGNLVTVVDPGSLAGTAS
jgi:predicted nucleic acid-binding protein